MLIARTISEIESTIVGLRADRRPLALVPTMGALHNGHLALVAAAKDSGAAVAASIFVNPLQFGPSEDLARYPRDEAGDLSKLEAAGCDLAWLPTVDVMYPAGDACIITVAGPALGFEGAVRPGHFNGVATVVAKLFGQTRADRAFFGAKDWQQAQVIRRMVKDLCLPIQITVVPTLRDPDGLAMSSRNRFLTGPERATAPALHRSLLDVAVRLRAGEPPGLACERAERELRSLGFTPDYLTLVDAESLQPIDQLGAGNRLLAGARLGSVRLLDNVEV